MFVVPHAIVMYNGKRFIDKRLRSLLEELRIKQDFVWVEHPQTNCQDEVANWVLIRGLK